jgi:Skp family chaperone for outer membrane proteins
MTMSESKARNDAFANFRRCCDDAPAGTYQQAKDLRQAIGDAMTALQVELVALGYKVDNCDRAHDLEAAMYAYVKASNPDATVFPTAEGFGDSMTGPARDRVIAQAASNAQAYQDAATGPAANRQALLRELVQAHGRSDLPAALKKKVGDAFRELELVHGASYGRFSFEAIKDATTKAGEVMVQVKAYDDSVAMATK